MIYKKWHGLQSKDKHEYIQRYKEHRKEQFEAKIDDANVVDIERNGQTWTIDI